VLATVGMTYFKSVVSQPDVVGRYAPLQRVVKARAQTDQGVAIWLGSPQPLPSTEVRIDTKFTMSIG